MKTCAKCHQTKNLDQFAKNSATKDGHQSYCRTCSTEYSRSRLGYSKGSPRRPKFMSDTHKECTKCHKVFPLENFTHTSYCHDCFLTYHKAKYPRKFKPMLKTDTHKQCRNCEQVLPLANFKHDKSTNCILCTRLLGRTRSLRRYGLTVEDYTAMVVAQNGACAICNKTQTKFLTVDHDHKCCSGDATRSCGKCIRGLICFECNVALGMAHDDVMILQSMINYLNRL